MKWLVFKSFYSPWVSNGFTSICPKVILWQSAVDPCYFELSVEKKK